MSSATQPSRALLIAAGLLTLLSGAVCLVLAVAALPIAHDLRISTTSAIATAVAAIAALVCGPLVWHGRLVPLALAAGLDIGLGLGLVRGGAAIGALLHLLPADELATADTLIDAAAIGMFVAATLCIVAAPTALKLRRRSRAEPPSSATEPSAATTLEGVGVARSTSTQLIRTGTSGGAPNKPLVIGAIALTLIALGIIVVAAIMGDDGAGARDVAATRPASGWSSSGSAAGDPSPALPTGPVADAPPLADASVPLPSLDDFVPRLHAALASATTADLAPLFDDAAFAFGLGAHDLAEGRDAIVSQLRATLGEPPAGGFTVKARFTHAANEGDAGWLAEQLSIGDTSFVISAVLAIRGDTWTIGALHWAQAMPNPTAARLAREGELAMPDAIPDAHDDSPLATAMRTAFSSRASYVEALSARDDAFNLGSAGERIIGGAAIRKVFARLSATIALRGAVKVGRLGAHGGWGVANVDFTELERDGTAITQTFRVLVAWVEEGGGWRIVQTQWSNAR